MFNRTLIEVIVVGVLSTFLLACVAQQKPLSQEPTRGQPERQAPKKAPAYNEKKSVPNNEPQIRSNLKKKTLIKKNKTPKSTGGSVARAEPSVDVVGLKNRLVGMDGTEILRLMGMPAFRRSEPPARIWQYRTVLCIVNIFLYETDRRMVAEYVELLGKNNTTFDEDGCFRSIFKLKRI